MDALLSVVHIFLRKKIVAPHSIFSIARGPSVVRTIAATVFPAFHGKLGKFPPSPKVWPCRKIRWAFPVFKHTVLRLPCVRRNQFSSYMLKWSSFWLQRKFSRTKQVFLVSISVAPLIRINAYGLEKGVIPSDWEYDKRRFMVNWALLSCWTQTNQLEILTVKEDSLAPQHSWDLWIFWNKSTSLPKNFLPQKQRSLRNSPLQHLDIGELCFAPLSSSKWWAKIALLLAVFFSGLVPLRILIDDKNALLPSSCTKTTVHPQHHSEFDKTKIANHEESMDDRFMIYLYSLNNPNVSTHKLRVNTCWKGGSWSLPWIWCFSDSFREMLGKSHRSVRGQNEPLGIQTLL